MGKVDTRILILSGLGVFAVSFYEMSHFSLEMGSYEIAMTGFIQGLGTGMVFTPMTVLAFATLDPALRTDGTGVFALLRNVGNSAGISVMQTMFTRTVQVVHSRLMEGVNPGNPAAMPPYLPEAALNTAMGAAAVDGAVSRQAAMVAYIDVYHMMFLTTVIVAPMVLFMRPGKRAALPPEEMVIE